LVNLEDFEWNFLEEKSVCGSGMPPILLGCVISNSLDIARVSR